MKFNGIRPDVVAENRITDMAHWHGERDELLRLLAAIGHHCDCPCAPVGASQSCCPPHRMLQDERLLDHLLFVFRARDRFWRSEWSTDLGAP